MDSAVLGAIADAISEASINEALDQALKHIVGGGHEERRSNVAKELSQVERRINRALDLLLDDDSPAADLKQRIREEQAKRDELVSELQALDQATDTAKQADEVRRELLANLADVRTLLGRTTAQARQMLRRLLVDKLMLEPIDGGYRFTGNHGPAGVLSVETRKQAVFMVAPTGFEPVFQP